MCGIAGIYSLRSDDGLLSDIRPMTEALRHRGPDDEGFVFFSKTDPAAFAYAGPETPEPVFHAGYSYSPDTRFNGDVPQGAYLSLGHRRLSIQDLSSAGHQPMCTEDGRYWIVHNGEIYNFPEIRRELEKAGETFVSDTDTEVILKSYRVWGEKCLGKFNGMWAFVIFDCQSRTLFISRDRFGIKPLYYTKNEDYFIFASEIKALLQYRAVTAAPNIPYCKNYLEKGFDATRKETAFENIYQFEFGSYLMMSLDDLPEGEIRTKKFWQVTVNLSSEPFSEVKARQFATRYYTLLKDAVRLRLRADVKVGSALSGGLDSSTIVYLINRQLNAENKTGKQETFSTVYKSGGHVSHCDESHYIDRLSSILDVKSNQIEPEIEAVANEHRQMIYAMENPPESTLMSSWHTFKRVAATDVTVTLDGQGADEQLAGYVPYVANHIANTKNNLFKEYKALKAIPGAGKYFFFGLLAKVLGWFSAQKIFKVILRAQNRKINPFPKVNEKLHYDTFKGLVTLINYADRTSMAFSIESRMPFMDYRLVEFISSVPAAYKIHNGWTKYLARLAMDQKLPDLITWRQDKMGWPVPEDYWFRGPLQEWLVSEIEDSAFLKRLGVNRQIRKAISGKASIKKSIRLLNLAIWHQVFFEKADKERIFHE